MMKLETPPDAGPEYALVERAITLIAGTYNEQPSLDELASALGESPFTLQKTFSRWAGVSPKKFVQYLTLSHAKERLEASDSVLDAAFDAGLSGPGRLHDLFVTVEAMTPGEWKAAAENLTVRYGWHDSPFGHCLIAATERGVCGLAFELPEGREATEANLFAPWARASMKCDASATAPYAESAFGGGTVSVVLRGTPFQLKVWEALLRIPPSALVSYSGFAEALGKPGAARAVAGAIGKNPVSWLVPCHRVIRDTGVISGYRWGPDRKRAMLAFEAAQGENSSP